MKPRRQKPIGHPMLKQLWAREQEVVDQLARDEVIQRKQTFNAASQPNAHCALLREELELLRAKIGLVSARSESCSEGKLDVLTDQGAADLLQLISLGCYFAAMELRVPELTGTLMGSPKSKMSATRTSLPRRLLPVHV